MSSGPWNSYRASGNSGELHEGGSVGLERDTSGPLGTPDAVWESSLTEALETQWADEDKAARAESVQRPMAEQSSGRSSGVTMISSSRTHSLAACSTPQNCRNGSGWLRNAQGCDQSASTTCAILSGPGWLQLVLRYERSKSGWATPTHEPQASTRITRPILRTGLGGHSERSAGRALLTILHSMKARAMDRLRSRQLCVISGRS
jgi:hypothetical protein